MIAVATPRTVSPTMTGVVSLLISLLIIGVGLRLPTFSG
jgi:hypothetical protein